MKHTNKSPLDRLELTPEQRELVEGTIRDKRVVTVVVASYFTTAAALMLRHAGFPERQVRTLTLAACEAGKRKRRRRRP